MADLPRTMTNGVRINVSRAVNTNAAKRGFSGVVCRIAVFSNSGVTAHNNPASITSITPGVNASAMKGMSQPTPGLRLSQYAPTRTNPTPSSPRPEGISFRKIAEISAVKTGLNIRRGVTNEASANFKALVEARCAPAFNTAEPSTPTTNKTSTVGSRGVNTKVNRPSNGREGKVTPHTTTITSASLSIRLYRMGLKEVNTAAPNARTAHINYPRPHPAE